MKFLELNGYIGIAANDATSGFIEIEDEGELSLIALARESGYAVTTDMRIVSMEKAQGDMVKAMFDNPYFQEKQAAIKAVEDSKPSIEEAFADYALRKAQDVKDNNVKKDKVK